MDAQNSEDRYPSFRVALHWLSAALAAFMLLTGFAAAASTAPDSKLALLQIHAAAGTTVLAVTTVWLLARLFGRRVPPLEGTWAVSRLAARAMHLLLPAILLLTATGGAATLYVSGALDIVLENSSPPFPDFFAFRVRRLHGLGARLVILFAVLHLIAAVYHHFIRRRPTFRRISF